MSAEVVAECNTRLAPLATEANTAWWDASTSASDDAEARRIAADRALSDALADPDLFAEVTGALATRPGGTLERELDVAAQMMLPNQIPAALRSQIIELHSDVEARFANHRAEIDGEPADDNEILEILSSSDDTARRRSAWEASKSIGPVVADDVRRLAHLRNDAARVLGYSDHFALELAVTDFDESRLFATLDEVDRITAQPFGAMKAVLDARLALRFGCSADQLRPWHYDDPFFQDPPAAAGVDLDPHLHALDVDDLTTRTFASMGIDISNVLARSDLLPRAGKLQHAFCIDVDRDGDVRVLSNNVPGERWSETMLHEFGHGAYFEGVGRDLPWTLRTMHMSLTEGVAMRCGRLVHDPDWLHSVAGIPATTVAELAPRLDDARRSSLLVFARWVLVMTHFERALYDNPDGPLDSHWWDLVERFQLVRRPDDRAAPDWAAKIHFAVAPAYYHNYLFGELVASQLVASAGGLVDNPAAGTFLAERVFAPGATMRWDHLMEHATGTPLTPAAFARELAR